MSDPKIDKAKGKLKEAAGKLTGDKRLETEGKLDQAGATVREKVAEVTGGVADVVGEVVGRASDLAADLKNKVTGKG